MSETKQINMVEDGVWTFNKNAKGEQAAIVTVKGVEDETTLVQAFVDSGLLTRSACAVVCRPKIKKDMTFNSIDELIEYIKTDTKVDPREQLLIGAFNVARSMADKPWESVEPVLGIMGLTGVEMEAAREIHAAG